MPISNAPHNAALPWLAALVGTLAVHPWTREEPAPVAAAQCSVTASLRDPEHLERTISKTDFHRLRADARQAAVESDEGLRLRRIRPGSLFAELGFESGDLIVDIAGGDTTRFRVLRGRGRTRRPIEIVLRVV